MALSCMQVVFKLIFPFVLFTYICVCVCVCVHKFIVFQFPTPW